MVCSAPLRHVIGGAYRLVEKSANRADYTGMPLKGLYLFAFSYLLTRKRVDILLNAHLIVSMIFLELVADIRFYCLLIASID